MSVTRALGRTSQECLIQGLLTAFSFGNLLQAQDSACPLARLSQSPCVPGRAAQWPWFQGDVLLVHLWEVLRAARKIFHEGNWKVFRLKGTRIGSLLFCRKRPFRKLWRWMESWDLYSDKCFHSNMSQSEWLSPEKDGLNYPWSVGLGVRSGGDLARTWGCRRV